MSYSRDIVAGMTKWLLGGLWRPTLPEPGLYCKDNFRWAFPLLLLNIQHLKGAPPIWEFRTVGNPKLLQHQEQHEELRRLTACAPEHQRPRELDPSHHELLSPGALPRESELWRSLWHSKPSLLQSVTKQAKFTDFIQNITSTRLSKLPKIAKPVEDESSESSSEEDTSSDESSARILFTSCSLHNTLVDRRNQRQRRACHH